MSAQLHDALWPSLDDLAGTYRKIRFPCLPRVDDLIQQTEHSHYAESSRTHARRYASESVPL